MIVETFTTESAVPALNALAQPTRLAVFRLLVRHGRTGLLAGELASQLDVAPNALSFHLKSLSQAGLVSSANEGRHVRYAANVDTMQQLIEFLSAECCQGNPQACFGESTISSKC